MACTRFEYVKHFENHNRILDNCWFIVRIDGQGFSKFTEAHQLEKPNDLRLINLMNKSALEVMTKVSDIVLAYGQSDEYSFVFKRETSLWNRRKNKILTHIVSLFTSHFLYYWSTFFVSSQPHYPPSFDGRVVCYPTDTNLKDYLSWRQADCHINNQYNTCFWNLVNVSKMSKKDANKRLQKTQTAEKNELLFTYFQLNYNELPAMYRKGTITIRIPKKITMTDNKLIQENPLVSDLTELDLSVNEQLIQNKQQDHHSGITSVEKKCLKQHLIQIHEDLIGHLFWEKYSFILK